MKRILVVCAHPRDKRELGLLGIDHEIIFHEEGKHSSAESSINDLLALLDNHAIDGVISSCDSLGALLSAVVAQRCGLLAPEPKVIAEQQNKFLARITHQQHIPYATPKFALLSSGDKCVLPFPFFVKPVRSSFSRGSCVVHTPKQQAEAFAQAQQYSVESLWSEIARTYSAKMDEKVLAEELCTGVQCTVEGFVCGGTVTIVGIVDSIMFPDTISFKQFNYPSSLPHFVQERLAHLATTLMQGIGFDNGFFNIECMYNAEINQIRVIEVNPRMASQFADLYQKVDGVNSYEQLVEVALGSEPRVARGKGKFAHAASCVLRVFKDHVVAKMPTQQTIKAVHAAHPDVRIELFGEQGQRLSDLYQDGKSYRYGLIHVGGDSLQDIANTQHEIEKMLAIELRRI